VYLRSTTIVTRLTEHDDVIKSLLRGAPRPGLALGPASAGAGTEKEDTSLARCSNQRLVSWIQSLTRILSYSTSCWKSEACIQENCQRANGGYFAIFSILRKHFIFYFILKGL